MSKQWNKHIHNRLKDFQQKAPEGLLDDIKSEMHRRGLSPVPADSSAATRPGRLLRAVSAAAILLIVSFIGYLWNESAPTYVTDIHHPSEAQDIRPIAFSELKPSATGRIAAVTPKPAARIPKLNVSASDILPNGQEAAAEKEKTEQTEAEKESAQNLDKGLPKDKTPDISASHTGPAHREPDWNAPSSRRKTPSFAMGTHISGVVAQMSHQSGEKPFIGADIPDQTNPDKPDSTSNAGSKASAHPNFRPQKKTVKHHQPIKFGVSFRYNLKPRWNIQTGLTYGYLLSEFSEEYTHQSEQTKQKLHYMGIPVQVGYQVWKKKRFNGYIALGGQAEKLVSGKATTLCWQNNDYRHSYTKSVSDNHLLFSALASIGAEYHLGHTVSLYAEPSVHYYFKNGSGLENHYTKQPLNFNLTIGLRFHWGK